MKKTNFFTYELTNQNNIKGFFNIYQAKNGSIYLQMGAIKTALTKKQLIDLMIDVTCLHNFNRDLFLKAYPLNSSQDMEKELNVYSIDVLNLSKDEKYSHVVVASDEEAAENIVFSEYDYDHEEETCTDLILINEVTGPQNKKYKLIVNTELLVSPKEKERKPRNKFEQLLKKSTDLGFGPDNKIYSLCIEDILCCLVDKLNKKQIDALTKLEFQDLIRKGIKGADCIPWMEYVNGGLVC